MTPNGRWRLKPCTECGSLDQMYGRRHRCAECRRKTVETPESIQKKIAQRASARAAREGKLVRQPCAACHLRGLTQRTSSQGHHEDYSKPLEVIWLCAVHHVWTHLYGLESVMRPRAAA